MDSYKVLVITESKNQETFKKKVIELLLKNKDICKSIESKPILECQCGLFGGEIEYNIDFYFITPSNIEKENLLLDKLEKTNKVIMYLFYDYSEDNHDSLMDLIASLIDTKKVLFKVYPQIGNFCRFDLSLIVCIRLNEKDLKNVLYVNSAKMIVTKWISAVFNIERILLSDSVSKFKNSICVSGRKNEKKFDWLKEEFLIID